MPRRSTKTKTMTKAVVSTRTAVAISVAVALTAGAVAAAALVVAKPKIVLRVSGSDTPASASYGRGAQDVPVLGLGFRATEALTLQALTLSFLGEKDADFSTLQKDLKATEAIEDCQLYDGAGAPVGTEKAFASAGIVRLSGFSVAIPANQALRLEARCDLKAGNPSDGTPDAFAISLPRAAFVAARTAANKTVPARSIEVKDRGALGVNVRGDRTLVTVSATSAPAPTPAPSLHVALASGSPSGAGIPGLAEVLRFNATANAESAQQINAFIMDANVTDVAASGWRDALKNASRWELYDIDDPSEKLDISWEFGPTAGNRFLAIPHFADAAPILIPASSTRTFIIRADTSGIGSGDSLRLDVNGYNPLGLGTDFTPPPAIVTGGLIIY